jgi:hypothetical protein
MGEEALWPFPSPHWPLLSCFVYPNKRMKMSMEEDNINPLISQFEDRKLENRKCFWGGHWWMM